MTGAPADDVKARNEVIVREAVRLGEDHAIAVIPIYGIAGGHCACGSEHRDKDTGKHPVGKDWQLKGTSIPEEIEERFKSLLDGDIEALNLGCPTGLRYGKAVLDVDKDVGGVEALAALEAQHGALPETWTSQTGSGGFHFFFLNTEQAIKNSEKNVGDGLDIRGEGGQVVLPPSLHRSGRSYAWLPGKAPGDVPLAKMPEWLIELAKKKRKKPGKGGGKSGEKGGAKGSTDAPENLDGTLGPLPSQIVYGEVARNGLLTKYAGAMRRYGFPIGAIVEALVKTDSELCRPPMGREECEKIARGMDRYPVSDPIKMHSSGRERKAPGPPPADAPPAPNLASDEGPLPAYLLIQEYVRLWQDGPRFTWRDGGRVFSERAGDTMSSAEFCETYSLDIEDMLLTKSEELVSSPPKPSKAPTVAKKLWGKWAKSAFRAVWETLPSKADALTRAENEGISLEWRQLLAEPIAINQDHREIPVPMSLVTRALESQAPSWCPVGRFGAYVMKGDLLALRYEFVLSKAPKTGAIRRLKQKALAVRLREHGLAESTTIRVDSRKIRVYQVPSEYIRGLAGVLSEDDPEGSSYQKDSSLKNAS